MTTTGSERVLHSFGTGSDGSFPDAGLRDVNGTLYGTTESGGSSNHGTVYRVSTTGAEKVLHSFAGGSDGAQPIADLINVGGMLYGTTWQGGGSYGSGTVYRISTAGVEKVLYSFAGGLDGALPEAGLINVNGTLYGTTIDGGAFHESAGYGTIYSVTTTGSEKVLHRFAGGSDGSQPAAGLINLKGILYGTTSVGGITQKCLYHSCGIVFALSR
ncbi:MAG: choice-of-anchor tandem repeat GloVer-containing protein [Candidatus Cybelea sp.]